MNQAHTDSTVLQIRSLREALERSGRATTNAEALAARALRDAQIERQRVKQMCEALTRASERLEQAESENRRLRSLVGGVLAENNSLTTELKQLNRITRDAASMEAPSINRLRLVQDQIEAA